MFELEFFDFCMNVLILLNIRYVLSVKDVLSNVFFVLGIVLLFNRYDMNIIFWYLFGNKEMFKYFFFLF